MREVLGAVVADPVEELAVLWQWHNGQYPLSTQGLAPGMVFLTLSPRSVDWFRVVVGGVREVAVGAGWSWPAVGDVVPVLVGEGSWVFVDSGRGPDRGAVFFAEASPPGPAVRVAGSLREFFEIVWFLVEAGWWRLGWDLGLVDVVGGGSVREAPVLSLVSELEAYRAALVAANPAWTDGLVPGRARAEVLGVLGGWVADPVEELVELWQWHDGQAEGTRNSLFQGMFFWGVDDPRLPLFRDYVHETRHIAVAAGLSWPAVEDAVPVLISPGGDAVFVDSGYSADRGCVFTTDHKDLAPALRVAGSLAEAVGLARLMVESGGWYFHEGRYLAVTRTEERPWF